MRESFKRKYQTKLTQLVSKHTGLKKPAAHSALLRKQQFRAKTATGKFHWVFNTAARQAKRHALRIAVIAQIYGVSSILHCVLSPGNTVQQQDPDSLPKKWRVFRRRFLTPSMNAGLVRAGFRVLHVRHGGLLHVHLLLFTSYRMAHHRRLYFQTQRGDFSGLPPALQKMIRRLELEAFSCGLSGIVKVRTSKNDSPRKIGTYMMKDLGACGKQRRLRPQIIKGKKILVFFKASDPKIFRSKLWPPIRLIPAWNKDFKAI